MWQKIVRTQQKKAINQRKVSEGGITKHAVPVPTKRGKKQDTPA